MSGGSLPMAARAATTDPQAGARRLSWKKPCGTPSVAGRVVSHRAAEKATSSSTKVGSVHS